MSKIETRICDKCKASDKGKLFDLEGTLQVPITTFGWPYKTIHFDLCSDCASAFKIWIFTPPTGEKK